MTWLDDLFGVPKPIIAMLHLKALPGDPGFDYRGGVGAVIESARCDLQALLEGGVDAVMISNEFSLPYLTQTEPITAITMARVIGELRTLISVPFGVNVLWDGQASLDLAAATGASFVREIFTGVYASDFGLWNTNVGAAARHRVRISGESMKMLCNVLPEGARYLADRGLADITRSTVFNARPDALVVSGLTAGAPTETAALKVVKENAGDVPVLVNTGVTPSTARQQLEIADGAVVGTTFKRDGVFENEVDAARVVNLMREVFAIRADLRG